MNSRPNKTGIFVIEGINSFAVTCYFSYFYFFTQKQFGFSNEANLAVAAASGLIYVPSALYAGKFAQRLGYYTALKTGYLIMLLALLTGGWLVSGAAAHIAVMLVTTIGMCFIWPTLEGFISEGESYDRLQHLLGIYNVVWAGTAVFAYMMGGLFLDRFGLNALFYVPAALMAIQLAAVFYLERVTPTAVPVHIHPAQEITATPAHLPAKTQSFLKMAWLANPFAYIAINTLIAVMPGVAARLQLSTSQAGLYCFLWSFARMGTFIGLWFWKGWHYKFRWLLSAYLALIVSFAVILLVPHLAVVVIAELVFGAAIGLIYYSSLFYSMDVGATKGEHGGIHEAAIGLGNFAGPALGAVWLHFSPVHSQSGAVAVSGLLICGLFGLLGLRSRKY